MNTSKWSGQIAERAYTHFGYSITVENDTLGEFPVVMILVQLETTDEHVPQDVVTTVIIALDLGHAIVSG